MCLQIAFLPSHQVCRCKTCAFSACHCTLNPGDPHTMVGTGVLWHPHLDIQSVYIKLTDVNRPLRYVGNRVLNRY